VRFLVDAQLPPALARWLVEQGHDASHVTDHGLGEASDRRIWDEAKVHLVNDG
jgi:predicted nuclease of predicted toxin-antitoxin system